MTLSEQLRRPRTSGRHHVTQHVVDAFAENIGDGQWIHVDPDPLPTSGTPAMPAVADA